MDAAECPACGNRMPIEVEAGKRGPYAGKRTAFCSFCGIFFLERKLGAFDRLLPKESRRQTLAPIPKSDQESEPQPPVNPLPINIDWTKPVKSLKGGI